MTTRTNFAKAALLAAAGAMSIGAVAAPTTASAQSGGYYGGGATYDPCKRESTGRAVVGGLLGAAIGAAVGSNAAARNARQDGALLGGAVGGIAGAAIGNRSAGCTSGQSQAYPAQSYNGAGYNGSAYYDRPARGQYGYNSGYADRRGYGYGRDVEVEIVEEAPPAPAADSCSLAESPIYLPDGRVQKRFVRVCRDSSGRYQVVD